MSESEHELKTKSRFKSCALLAFGPVLLLAIVILVFFLNNRVPNIQIPTHDVPRDNGYDYCLRAANMLGIVGPSSSAIKPPEAWTVPELRQFLVSNKPALDMLRKGLKRKWVQPAVRSALTPFPEYAQCRELARRLVDEAKYYRAVGRYLDAANSHLDCIEYGAMFPRGGNLIAGLVGLAIESIGMHEFGSLLPKLDSRELEQVAERLEQIEAKRVSWGEVIREEGRCSAAVFIEALRDPRTRRSLANPVSWKRELELFFGDIPKTIGMLDMARYAFSNKTTLVKGIMSYCDSLAAEQYKPYTGKSSVPVPDNIYVRFLAPTFARYREPWETRTAVLTVLKSEIALRRYRLDHGKYPDRLSDLVPTYLKSVPTDPFGMRKPLRYKVSNGGRSFLLYSLGPNMTDDGGSSPPEKTKTWETGDIVAGQW